MDICWRRLFGRHQTLATVVRLLVIAALTAVMSVLIVRWFGDTGQIVVLTLLTTFAAGAVSLSSVRGMIAALFATRSPRRRARKP